MLLPLPASGCHVPSAALPTAVCSRCCCQLLPPTAPACLLLSCCPVVCCCRASVLRAVCQDQPPGVPGVAGQLAAEPRGAAVAGRGGAAVRLGGAHTPPPVAACTVHRHVHRATAKGRRACCPVRCHGSQPGAATGAWCWLVSECPPPCRPPAPLPACSTRRMTQARLDLEEREDAAANVLTEAGLAAEAAAAEARQQRREAGERMLGGRQRLRAGEHPAAMLHFPPSVFPPSVSQHCCFMLVPG